VEQAQLMQLAGQFGPLGLFIGYLIWREQAERKDKAAAIVSRNEIDKAEIASRLDLARTLAKLTMVVEWFIQGKANV
jgi:hypothetical protein